MSYYRCDVPEHEEYEQWRLAQQAEAEAAAEAEAMAEWWENAEDLYLPLAHGTPRS